jgi:hypothetical protein
METDLKRELELLYRMLRAVWQQAMAGDPEACHQASVITARISVIFGV